MRYRLQRLCRGLPYPGPGHIRSIRIKSVFDPQAFVARVLLAIIERSVLSVIVTAPNHQRQHHHMSHLISCKTGQVYRRDAGRPAHALPGWSRKARSGWSILTPPALLIILRCISQHASCDRPDAAHQETRPAPPSLRSPHPCLDVVHFSASGLTSGDKLRQDSASSQRCIVV